MLYLGIDTSNYTTSAAVYNTVTGEINQKRKLLAVKPGELGLRQSAAVFQHLINLPDIVKGVLLNEGRKLAGVAVSASPNGEKGSYMPCFMVGRGAAETIAAAVGVQVEYFSHQLGHIAAALYSGDRMDIFGREFIAFHVSGGTTQVLKVTPDKDRVFNVKKLACSLDLNAGQAIDRVGKLLSIPFPAGRALDELSLTSAKNHKIKPFMKNGCCSFSGLQNKCEKMKTDSEADADIAKYCIDYIYEALKAMTDYVLSLYPGLPVVYSGGVLSNTLIRKRLKNYLDSAVFAAEEYSSDNAAGIAVLASI